MGQRRDAVAVAAGSINLIPGKAHFSLDLKATHNTARDSLEAGVLLKAQRIAVRHQGECAHHLRAVVALSPTAIAPTWCNHAVKLRTVLATILD